MFTKIHINVVIIKSVDKEYIKSQDMKDQSVYLITLNTLITLEKAIPFSII
jgi:hypothetical protein